MTGGSIRLETLLVESDERGDRRLTLFAILDLGLIEPLAHGLVSVHGAVRLRFNAENCLFARNQLRE